MAQRNQAFVVGFTRLDGQFRHAEVNPGTKLEALLRKFGYSDAEIDGSIRDCRINGQEFEGGREYVLQKDDVVAMVPAVKGG